MKLFDDQFFRYSPMFCMVLRSLLCVPPLVGLYTIEPLTPLPMLPTPALLSRLLNRLSSSSRYFLSSSVCLSSWLLAFWFEIRLAGLVCCLSGWVVGALAACGLNLDPAPANLMRFWIFNLVEPLSSNSGDCMVLSYRSLGD